MALLENEDMKMCCRLPFLIVVPLLLMAACVAKQAKGNRVTANQTFALLMQDSVQFVADDTQFWLHLLDIQDNRCPQDVQCITAGKAQVQLALREPAQKIFLCLGADCFGENQNIFLLRFNNRSYNIVLEAVQPHPGNAKPQETAQAILKIKRATG